VKAIILKLIYILQKCFSFFFSVSFNIYWYLYLTMTSHRNKLEKREKSWIRC